MNIYTGLLFLDGHIADPRLAADLAAGEPGPGAPGGPPPPVVPAHGVGRARSGRGLLRRAVRLGRGLVFLGGRPMTAGHNDDIDEPFPQLQGDRAAIGRNGARARARKDLDAARAQSRLPSCAHC